MAVFEKRTRVKYNSLLFVRMVGHKKYLYQYVYYFAANCFPLLIQQNNGGSSFFGRSWAEFKVGFTFFGPVANYWIGNDLLSQLTMNGHRKLRIDLQLRNLSWYYAEYRLFIVLSEAHGYRMVATGYSGNAGDALRYHNNMMFATHDRDRRNCARYNDGGFWYNSCAWCSVNTVRGRGDDFRWYTPETGNLLLQTSRMWLTC